MYVSFVHLKSPQPAFVETVSVPRQRQFFLMHFSHLIKKLETGSSWNAFFFAHISAFKYVRRCVSQIFEPHWQITSVLFQPKLSVRSAVEALCWSTSSRLAKSLCSCNGITLTCKKADKTVCTQTDAERLATKPRQCRYLLWPLACLYLPGVLVALAPNRTAPLQKMRNRITLRGGGKRNEKLRG